jgi:hypothetical protein
MKAQIVKLFHELFPLGPFVKPDGTHVEIIQFDAAYLGLKPCDGLLFRLRVQGGSECSPGKRKRDFPLLEKAHQ